MRIVIFISMGLLLLALMIEGIQWGIYDLEKEKFIEVTINGMSKPDLLEKATFDKSISPTERKIVEGGQWTLAKKFVSEGKGRGDFQLKSPNLDKVCLTALRQSGGLALLIHKDCDTKF